MFIDTSVHGEWFNVNKEAICVIFHLYAPSFHDEFEKAQILRQVGQITEKVIGVDIELHYNIDTIRKLGANEIEKLQWLLSVEQVSRLDTSVLEVGPQLKYQSPWSSNAVSICQSCGLDSIQRVEMLKGYKFKTVKGIKLTTREIEAILPVIHDRMTEQRYTESITTFETGLKPAPMAYIDILGGGIDELRHVNTELGAGMDEQAIEHFLSIFKRLDRNPTDVELFNYGTLTSEHCRHGFFNGKIFINGKVIPETLFQIIKSTLKPKSNATIAFHDNSSAIRGFKTTVLLPQDPTEPSVVFPIDLDFDLIVTVETHNYPTLWHPFQGATTGTGGVFRDIFGTGVGAYLDGTIVGYSVGNLRIPGYVRPWEDPSFTYDPLTALPLKILIDGSNGATDYCNKLGVPAPIGITREFGMRLPNGERTEYVKPILLAGAVGKIDRRHIKKDESQARMLAIRFGGPDYRIGFGGGPASSMIQGENKTELDESAVQRGDAGKEQPVWRVIDACVKLGDKNPISKITDLGAGGNCVAFTEIVEPAGAKFNLRKFTSGDKTLSPLEQWCNESQERMAILIWPKDLPLFAKICKRENCLFDIVGKVTGDGKIVLYDESDGSTPIDMDLKDILSELPQKTFKSERIKPELEPFKLPDDLTIEEALGRVFRNITVGSKQFLMQKGDRSIRGNTVQQQCCGPLQLPVADCAVLSLSHFSNSGQAISIGEQPIKGLINYPAMGRMSVAEAITNLIGTKVSKIEDIKASGNWMWAAKLPGEGANIYDTAVAIRDFLWALDIGIIGGKDSLSMAAQILKEVVKSPGTFVFTTIAPVPDIKKVVTPDIKKPGESSLMLIDISAGMMRMGGSILAQVFGQIGNKCPDIDYPKLLKSAFEAIQELIDKNLILSLHDRSDGGLITTLLEMAFAGNCGLEIDSYAIDYPIEFLFNEEAGVVIEYLPKDEQEISHILMKHGLFYEVLDLGRTRSDLKVVISQEGNIIFESDMPTLRALWEETSYQIELLQKNPECTEEERKIVFDRKGPKYSLSFDPQKTPNVIIQGKNKPKAAIIRGEGSNGDDEMRTFFHLAGFDVFDIATSDLVENRATLDDINALATVGGFTYSDVFGSAIGWAGVTKFNERARYTLDKFYWKPNSVSFHVCNGCQWALLTNWVPGLNLPAEKLPRLVRNKSGVFEHRYPTIKILPTNSIWLSEMEGTTFGIWTAHGEGRFEVPDVDYYFENKMIPLVYVDDDGLETEVYPFNPNGSVRGIAGMVSANGRHLAMMPHPERLHRIEVFPYIPSKFADLKVSPWLKISQNAYNWVKNS